jgi:hypothetical protein
VSDKIKEMTIEQAVLSMFRAATVPVTEEEYKTLRISKFNILKRREFSNIYRSLVLYLMKRSIPVAFPGHASQILETFEAFFQQAYKDHPKAKKRMEDRFKKFDELLSADAESPFLELALHVSKMLQRSPKAYVYGIQLNSRIELLYLNFITMGKEIKIKESPTL